MSYKPPNSSPVREATKGVLDWTEEKVKAFLTEFSKESKRVVGQQTLKEQMGLLERLLRKVL